MSATSTLAESERRLWDAADDLRANSKLRSSEYSVPVLGLIFLRYADYHFAQVDARLKATQAASKRPLPRSKARYQAEGVLFLTEAARFGALLQLPEGVNIGAAINEAMRAIETENDELKDVLPKTYSNPTQVVERSRAFRRPYPAKASTPRDNLNRIAI